MLSSLELSRQDFVSLKEECRRHNIELFSTAFDDKSITLVSEFNDTDYVKVPSGEITNLPYLRRLAVLGKNVILSTGMSDLSDHSLLINPTHRMATVLSNKHSHVSWRQRRRLPVSRSAPTAQLITTGR